METLYGSHEELHCSTSSVDLSDKVQSLASGVYNEFEIMMSTYGEGVIKDLMPQVVMILESLNQAYRDKQEHEVELELLRVEHDNLKTQFEREKLSRKASEQKYLEVEDILEEERKMSRQKAELQDSTVRTLQVKIRNTHDLLSRHEEREKEMKDEYSKLHNKYNELFRNHVDFVERAKLQQAESPLRMKVGGITSGGVTPASSNSKSDSSTAVTSSPSNTKVECEKLSGANESDDRDIVQDVVPPPGSDTNLVDLFVKSPADDQKCDSMNEERDITTLPTLSVSQENKEAVIASILVDTDRVNDAVSSEGMEVNSCDNSTDGAVANNIKKDRCDTVGNVADLNTRDNSDTLDNDAIVNTRHDHSIEWSGCDGEYDQSDRKKMESTSHDVDVMLDDDSQIENCFNSPYGVGISSLGLAEFDEFCDNAALEETKSLSEYEGSGSAAMHLSLYEELCKHDTTVLGEMDNGADIAATGVSAAVENLILENKELLATKNALNIVKDDLISQLDELSGEIDLLKEENTRLQQVVEERNTRVTELEMEMKKIKEANSEKQISGSNDSEHQSHFTRIDLMRVLIERNQYKERLMELQEAIRRADMARAAAKESQEVVSKPVKKKSSVWGFFSGLISGDDDDNASNDWNKKTAVI